LATELFSGDKTIYKKRIRLDTGLTDVGVCQKRLDGSGDASRLYEIHIEDGIAKTSIMNYPDTHQAGFLPAFTVGEAKSVAITFDGRWEEYGEILRIHTYDKPYIFWADNSGVLKWQLWDETDTVETLYSATPIDQVRTIRAWKSDATYEDDMGIVAGYIKNDGSVWYKQYIEDVNGDFYWTSEEEISEFTGTAVNLNLFLCNDFRVGFFIEDSLGDRHWYIAKRNYVGVSIPDENVNVALTSYVTELNPVTDIVVGDGDYPTDDARFNDPTVYQWEAENINANITDYETMILWGTDTLPATVLNVESTVTQSEAEFDTGDGIQTAFETGWYPIVPDTETIKINGVLQSTPADYTIDYPTGTVTFSSTPADGVSITGAYDWYSYGHKIKIEFEHGIQGGAGIHSQFAIEDDATDTYVCSATAEGDPWADPIPTSRFTGTRTLFLTTSNFNECSGNLTINYTSSAGTLQGEAEQDFGNFVVACTPVGLITQRINVDPPEVEAIFNE